MGWSGNKFFFMPKWAIPSGPRNLLFDKLFVLLQIDQFVNNKTAMIKIQFL